MTKSSLSFGGPLIRGVEHHVQPVLPVKFYGENINRLQIRRCSAIFDLSVDGMMAVSLPFLKKA